MPKPQHISDRRMLQMIDALIIIGVIETRQEFLNAIGMRKENFNKILSKELGFQKEHITKACRIYKINLNWLFGIEKERFREEIKPPISRAAVTREIKKRF